MPMTYDEVISIRDALKPKYEDYHSSRKKLRQFWHGRYWEDVDGAYNSGNVSTIFKDITARTSDIGPDIKLVYNLLKDVAVKYQTYLSPLPMIRMYTDPPASATRKAQSTLKERYLYGLWNANNANKIVGDKAWYLPLMGDAFLGIFPDMEKSICRMVVRSPEHAFPLPKWDYDGNDGIIFSWKTSYSSAKRGFPNWSGVVKARNTGGRRKKETQDPQIEIVEYYDDDCFYRWVEGEQVAGVEHNFGFNLFEHVKFINVPGEVFGHGAVEQSVNLVEMGNAYLSLQMQSAIENVFPVMVLEDAMKAPETIQRGAGAVIPVNAGGKVYYLEPPARGLMAGAEWATRVEQMIKTDTSMPDVNFGQADQSIVTGKAINELQGAGTGSLVEMVQGLGIGAALVSWNEKAITIGRTMFKDDTIRLYGQEASSIATVNPRNFSMNIKGSQLVGSTRNEVVFMPSLDMHTKVVIGLQMAGGGLVSKKWQRENVGIPDSEAMDEEIVGEVIEAAALQMVVQSIVDPASMGDAENQADAIIEGHPLLGLRQPPTPGIPSQAPPPPPGPGAGSGAGGPLIGTMPGGGQDMSPALMQPPGSPPPAGGPTPPPTADTAAGAGQGVPLDQAISAFQGLQVSGQVFIVGEIVMKGSTTSPVEVRVTDASDRNVVSQVPFPVVVRVIPSEPQEPYVEVTPGANPVIHGEEPTPEDIGMGG